MTAQGDRQAAVRAYTGTALSYEGDWEALFDLVGISPDGGFNGRLLAWINYALGSSYTNINDAMAAYAATTGATNWSSMSTVPTGGGGYYSAFLTGTPMDTDVLTFQHGKYVFTPATYSHQMQVSDDGVSFSNIGAPFSGDTYTLITSLVGKYLRGVENVVGPNGETATSTTQIVGPVVAAVALPGLPLANSAPMSFVGHSQLAYLNKTSGPGYTVPTADKAPQTQAQSIFAAYHAIDPRFNMDSWYDTTAMETIAGANQSVFGAHEEAMPPWMDTVLAHGTKVAVIMSATNTISTGDTTAGPANAPYCMQATDQLVAKARKAGAITILMCDYPRGAWIASAASDDAKNAALVQYNNWVRAQVGRSGVYVVDNWPVLAPGGVMDQTLFESDLTHLNPRGAMLAAQQTGAGSLQAAIQAIYSAGEYFSTDPTTADNLVSAANYNWAATKAAPGGGMTGTIAQAITMTGPSAGMSTVVCSMEQIGSTGRWRQRLDITPFDNGSGNQYHGLTMQLANTAITGLVAGDWVKGNINIELGGANDGLNCARVRPQITQVNTVAVGAYFHNEASGDFSGPNKLPKGVRKVTSMPMQIPVGASFDRGRMFVELYWDRTGQPFTVWVDSYKVAEITDPRPVRGY